MIDRILDEINIYINGGISRLGSLEGFGEEWEPEGGEYFWEYFSNDYPTNCNYEIVLIGIICVDLSNS